ncbi:uncharacterized protein LAESUDRAFT_693231 [Laetiporus sulphureus 93-53]|uniref:Uncharacterized protein n=1 Tax=Laetiporus sulphureus 93-53 TaxID=1314785 RepID=A0A165GUH4_9APHY|nr:uncharacterized protein LAESUDRAFT_693231 [Laetiporus sulphureus 93-53]KZT10831.1 hypothetical protein LAESUDRAFT_693231 [Laetiporus sulphureus 93-53]
MLGPPPSAAGPSQRSQRSPQSTARKQEDPERPESAPQLGQPSIHFPEPPQKPTYASAAQLQPAYVHNHNATANSSYQYYNYPLQPTVGWGNAWPMNAYAFPAGYHYSFPQAQYSPQDGHNKSAVTTGTADAELLRDKRSPSPSLAPQTFHRHWDSIFKSFFASVGLSQALRGFEADMVIMNPEWERENIPKALDELRCNLTKLAANDASKVDNTSNSVEPQEQALDTRKLGYAHFAQGVEHRSQESITKSISRFLAQSRGRNDVSNRSEFLNSIAEKRRRLNEGGDFSVGISSCARTDAKTQDREIQMKYDIAKNEDGPLRRTVQNASAGKQADSGQPHRNSVADSDNRSFFPDRFHGLDERLRNIESHLAVRYVPSSPRSMLDRLKYLEDHIVQLERDYPPWAALHFNQPRRGWPPPPRPTPIVVPSHLASVSVQDGQARSSLWNIDSQEAHPQASTSQSMPSSANENADTNPAKGKGRSTRNASSLHKAVMEKLEVQKAMHDFITGSGTAE